MPSGKKTKSETPLVNAAGPMRVDCLICRVNDVILIQLLYLFFLASLYAGGIWIHPVTFVMDKIEK